MLFLVSMDNYILIDVKNAIYNIDVNVKKYSGQSLMLSESTYTQCTISRHVAKKRHPHFISKPTFVFQLIFWSKSCYFMTIFLSNIKLLIMISFLQIIIQFSCMNVYTCNIVPSHDTNYIKKKNTAFYIDEVRLEPGKC